MNLFVLFDHNKQNKISQSNKSFFDAQFCFSISYLNVIGRFKMFQFVIKHFVFDNCWIYAISHILRSFCDGQNINEYLCDSSIHY
jgi:hypothetical protein